MINGAEPLFPLFFFTAKAEVFNRSAYHYPDKKTLIFGDTILTYAELEAAGNRLANDLNGLGVKKYDRVAILAHNTIHHVLT
jgi:fatty-acyl-CoA synthase